MQPRRRFSDRLLVLLGVRIVVWTIAASAFLQGALVDPLNRITVLQDEHGTLMHEEAARKTYVEYHQLPAWNPYTCGGIVGIANAPDNEAAPDFIWRILFGTLAGRRITAIFFAVLGMEGVFRWARRNGASSLGAAMGAIAFSTFGHFANLLSWGWVFMYNYNLVPWVALGYEEGLRTRGWWIAGGAFMAWIVLGGGTYVAPYAGLLLFMLLVAETIAAVRDKTMAWWHPAMTLVKMAGVAAGIAALRLLPLLQLLFTHARPVEQKDMTAPLTIFAWLALRKSDQWCLGGSDYYIGIVVVVLAIVAVLRREGRALRFFAIALVFAWIACGEFSEDAAPYVWLRKLPVYSQLRFPERMTTMAALCLAVAGAFGLTAVEDGLTRIATWIADRIARFARAPRIVPIVRLAFAAAAAAVALKIGWIAVKDVIATNRVKPGTIFVSEGPIVYPDQFHQARGNRWDAHVWPFANRGSLHCFEEHELFTSKLLRGDLAQEEYPAPESKDLTVQRLAWSPNEILLQVHAPSGGRVLVNQNHNAAWHSDVGELASDGGLISVSVPPGDHRVRLWFRDSKMVLGGFITLGTLAWIGMLAVRRLRTRVHAWRRLWRTLR